MYALQLQILKRDKYVNFHIINWITENCLNKRNVAVNEFGDRYCFWNGNFAKSQNKPLFSINILSVA